MILTPAQRIAALQLEFERLKQRADYIDRMLQGHPDSWCEIKAMIPDGSEVVIDKLVGEGRQTATAMASIAKTLTALGDGEVEVPEADPLQKMQDEVAARRAKKAQ